MNPRDRFEFFSPQVAMKKIKADPTIRAAVAEGHHLPVLTHSKSRVRLFDKVGDADTYLRARIAALTEAGYVKTWGTLRDGVFKFEREFDEPSVILALDKRR